MKTAEKHTSSTASHQVQRKQQPFFNKEGEGNFFAKVGGSKSPFFSKNTIQPRPVRPADGLTMGRPNDKYEVEADAMADKVVQRLNNTKNGKTVNSQGGGRGGSLQSKCENCDKEEKLQKKEEPLASKITSIQRKPIFESNTEETETRQDSLLQKKCVHCDQEKKLQRQEEEKREGIQAKSNSGSQTLEEEKLQTKSTGTPNHLSGLEGQLRSAGNGGRTMAPDLQKSIGDAFGADFSKVRIHTTGKAVQMNRDLRGQAFTHGQDIYFNEGKYRPETSSGKHLLAHELTHTLQQGAIAKSIKTKLEPSDGFALKTPLAKSRQGGKHIEESENPGRKEFTKIQKKSVPAAGADSLNHGSSSLKNLISHKPLQFVQAKKKDSEIDKDLEEKEGAGIQTKMDTLLRDSGRERKDEFMKGRSWEEAQADKMILFKKEPSLQLSPAGPSDETSMRNRIVEVAKKELSKVEARRDDGSGRRVGADRLLEYFHLAAPNEWSDAVIEQSRYTMEAKQFPHWCGIFSVYAIKKAGIDVGDWKMGVGVSQFNTLQQTDMPQKGDIGYIHEPWRHHSIITEVNGDTIKSIDGNSGTKSEVLERTRPITDYTGFFTAFTGSEKYIQKKEETADSTSNINGLEQELDAASGKGVPLDTEPRGQMERGFGADFGDVNIHTDSQAVRMNKNLGAQAFTYGNDIYFNAGKYRPETTSGKHLLAHELTHTVQQGAAGASLKEQK